ncbi:MAG: hypothetical protein MUE40_03925 [Anaerolineae bacterium]|jgi:hypothetical protein|nr:hypothetical protein [Anaerolineae bacterium]
MNNAGRLNDGDGPPEAPRPAAGSTSAGSPSALFLVGSGVLVALAAVLVMQALPILYGIFFPPSPPIPAGSVQLTHRNRSYGVDEWTYQVDTRACEVVTFFQSSGGTCPGAYQCAGIPAEEPLAVGQHVAECTGQIDFSIFTLRWIATVASAMEDGRASTFQVSREIFWGGQIPPDMADLIEQIEAVATITPTATATATLTP